MSSSSPSSSGAGGQDGYPRASLARTSTSNQPSEETISSANAAFYASWEQSSDIRGDLATGWGVESSNGGWGLGGRDRSVAAANQNIIDNDNMEDDQWGWRLQNSAVRHVPAFYPMDSRSTRRIDLVNDLVTDDISCRISTACQRLSIHCVWDNMCPSAALCSMELVEMEVNIYFGEADGAGECLCIIPCGEGDVLLPVVFHFFLTFLFLAVLIHSIPTSPSGRSSKTKGLFHYIPLLPPLSARRRRG